MRFNLKLLLWILTLGIGYVTLLYWSRCSAQHEKKSLLGAGLFDVPAKVVHAHLNQVSQVEQDDDDTEGATEVQYREIECIINEEYSVPCRRENEDVYVPFSFLSKYFEITGKVANYDGYERFEWRHSNAQIYRPAAKYTPDSVFMNFEHYSVELRDRVKCISGIEGVPVSTQWAPEGHFYPIQIAQYGLSHYSKWLTEKPRTKHVLEDAEDGSTGRWSLTPSGGDDVKFNNVQDRAKSTSVIEFNLPESMSDPGLVLTPPSTVNTNFFLGLNYRFINNGSITVKLETKGRTPSVYYLHYVCIDTMLQASGSHIVYGVGTDRTAWGRMHRDLRTDFQKGLKLGHRSKAKWPALRHILKISIHGTGALDNLTLSSSSHLAQFYAASDWLVDNQDARGGWPIAVTRSLANGALKLDPGWYSAMGQGQAMSLLMRAYLHTREKRYLRAASRATQLFSVASDRGGVVTHFMAGPLAWYEEYPTTPSCFVLNGFIYALLGLYDLKTAAPPGSDGGKAERLYEEGVASLCALLPLFDTGSGSIYDLRHLTLGVAPNLARWDYHATHINQLLLLSTLHEDKPILEETAKRWISYSKGHRAAHN